MAIKHFAVGCAAILTAAGAMAATSNFTVNGQTDPRRTVAARSSQSQNFGTR